MHEPATLIHPEPRESRPGISSGLPADLLIQSAGRLRVLALLYAFVFFMAGIFPALFLPAVRAQFLGNFLYWGPGVIGVLLGLGMAALVGRPGLSAASALRIGLAFEITSSYAIAAAEFADPMMLQQHQGFMGLSWVAVWVVLFTVVIPTPPRRAVVAALASVSSVPVVIGFIVAIGLGSVRINPGEFFFGLVFPYLLVVGMAYVGARVVYQLGTEVKRARELGSYRLEEKLGEGGMGEVWRARHRMLARPAAIKLIRPALAGNGGVSTEMVRRFEREAQVIAGLRSPHTVDLFDFGMADDGAFYYVMELLDGLDADSLLRRFGPIPPERAIYLLRQVCHSLSEAQSSGLVHRDIKPANIFLCRYGEEYDFVKVLDFGIVGAARDSAEPASMHTRENVVKGTPAFMAPEQVMGTGLDGRADIYATGCVAYWLLTGTYVFTSDTTMGLLLHHAQTPPTPPSARTELPIPPALDQLVLSCLAKDPAKRPQTARELSQRLAELEGADPWTQERARDWWERHRP
ncbi:MAG TPA: serine/threonine-protein kinase [Gemmatimonadales bacterium]|jgi:serine/threonine-protein kinase|nr:serine/threonine-protein kinase [Gemmatimonadales bacterium]